MERTITNLISIQIVKFYISVSNRCPENIAKYFTTDGTLNFIEITNLLQCSGEDLEVCKYEDFLRCYERVLPIYMECQRRISGKNSLKFSLEWLGSNYKYVEQAIADRENVTATVENVLLLTALLEYALGNVYTTLNSAGRSPPHLLKDLLCARELQEFYGIEAITFLRLLLGTPKSINLRNIVWHGFPKAAEVPPYYVGVLLLTMHSLGCMLQTRNLVIQQRVQIQNFFHHISNYEDFTKELFSNAKEEEVHQLFENCTRLDNDYIVYWEQLYRYYTNGNYWRFVILVLPQIELVLRLYYGHINSYDVTAKLDEYYITMDTIFESHVPITGEKNRLLLFENSISEGALNCLYDLFIAPKGPRLRDKVSHGEVSMDAINNASLCHLLLYLSLNLLTTNEVKFPLGHYESKYHLNCLAKMALHDALKQLRRMQRNFLTTSIEQQEVISTINKISIFQRPKKEAELMLLILKNTQSVRQTCVNYEESIQERLSLLDQRELHSKRRRTLEKQLAALPDICGALYEITNCMETIFVQLQTDNSKTLFESTSFERLLRFLKCTLKICENFVKYSGKDSNEWIKALELCRDFQKKRQTYLRKS